MSKKQQTPVCLKYGETLEAISDTLKLVTFGNRVDIDVCDDGLRGHSSKIDAELDLCRGGWRHENMEIRKQRN